MSGKQSLLCIGTAVCVFMLAACANEAPESPSGYSEHELKVASSVLPQEDKKQNPELVPVIAEIAMETVNVACDATEFSGGSLALGADNELLLSISKIFYQYSFEEELDLAHQPPYANFVRVTSARGADDWALTFLEESANGSEAPERPATFLSLMKRGYPEPLFFPLDRAAFEQLYEMAGDRVYFVEPPAEEFVEPLSRLLQAYRDGTVKNNDMEPRLEPFLKGGDIPDVRSADDFAVKPGNEMAAYYAEIPIGDGTEYKMMVGMALLEDAEGQGPHWAAVSASIIIVD